MKETIGLAAMKTRTARAKSATPPQKRRGIWGRRISLPGSNGPPRSKGSNGRYRLDTLSRSLDGVLEGLQSAIVRREIGVRNLGRVLEVPPHGRAQRRHRVGRRPPQLRPRLTGAGGDVLRHVPGSRGGIRPQVVEHPNELGAVTGRHANNLQP